MEDIDKGMHRRGAGSRRRRALTGLAFAFLASSTAHAALGTAVEYYNPALRHYFVTAYPEEAAALDAGTNVKGWVRTGGQFTVFTEPAEGLSPVCRFFGTPGLGLNSHFYTANQQEMEFARANYPAFKYEGVAYYTWKTEP